MPRPRPLPRLPAATGQVIHHPMYGSGLRWTVPGTAAEDGPPVDVYERGLVLAGDLVVEQDRFTSFVRLARAALGQGEPLAAARLDAPVTLRTPERALVLGAPTLCELLTKSGRVCGRVIAAGGRALLLTADAVAMRPSWPPPKRPRTLREVMGDGPGSALWRGDARATLFAAAFDPRVSEVESPSPDPSASLRDLGRVVRSPGQESVALWVTPRRLTAAGTDAFVHHLLSCGWTATDEADVVTLHKNDEQFARIWTASRRAILGAASQCYRGEDSPELMEDLS